MSLQKRQIEQIEESIKEVLDDVQKLVLLCETVGYPENQRVKTMKLRDKLILAHMASTGLKGVCDG